MRNIRRRLSIIALLAIGGLAAFGAVQTSQPQQRQASIPPTATSTSAAPTQRSVYNNDHRIDTCALLPVKAVNNIAPDLAVNMADLLPSGNDPTKTGDYEDNCQYAMVTTTPSGGISTDALASFTIMGYGSRQTISDGFTFHLRGPVVASLWPDGIASTWKFHAASGKIFDQQVETIWNDRNNKPTAFDLLFVYTTGDTSYLIEVSSGVWLSDPTVQNLLSMVTDQLPDLKVTSMNIGGKNDLQV
ncbi:MAG TPA: hypothetical protein VLG92_03020 [Candidatus Saccharimonadia bacterium]|nr:hypothetical protein [Candidatus Saccharimonadia bacterium]